MGVTNHAVRQTTNGGEGMIPKPDNLLSPWGWLSPKGDWYSCDQEQHELIVTPIFNNSGIKLSKDKADELEPWGGPSEYMMGELLSEIGWGKVTSTTLSDHTFGFYCLEPTAEQRLKMKKWFKEWGSFSYKFKSVDNEYSDFFEV